MAERVDVLILTALKSELDALIGINEPDSSWIPATDSSGFRYFTADITRTSGASFRAAAARAVEMGETATAAAAMRLIFELRPLHLAMCGICAGARDQVGLGDVVVADRIFKFDGGSLRTTGNGSNVRVQISHDLRTYNLRPLWRQQAEDMDDSWSGQLGRPPRTIDEQALWLLQRLDRHRSGSSVRTVLKALGKSRQKECPHWPDVIDLLRERGMLAPRGLSLTASGREKVLEEQLRFPDGRPARRPRVHVGAVGTSARVQRDPGLFKELRKVVRKTIAVEMEGAALGAVADMLVLPSIMVKSVVDFADGEKSDHFHEFGAKAAAEFLLAFLRHHLPISGPSLSEMSSTPLVREQRKLSSSESGFHWLLLRTTAAAPSAGPEFERLLRKNFADPTIEIRDYANEPMLKHVTSRSQTFERIRALLQRRALPAPLGRLIRYVARWKGHDVNDKNEGKFGRSPCRKGRMLWASVRSIATGWYEVELEVTALNGELEGQIEFHLHDSFPHSVLIAEARNNRASVSIECFGSFVVGAVLDKKRTKLELDLGGLPGVPRGFIDE